MKRTTLSRKDLAAALNISPSRVSELYGLGILPREADGTYHFEICQIKYAEYRDGYSPLVNSDLNAAKTKLTAERAKQKWIGCMKLAGSMLPRAFVEKFHEYQRNVVEKCVLEMVENIANKIEGREAAVKIGLVIVEETDRTLRAIADGLSGEDLVALHPGINTPIVTEECKTDFNSGDPMDDLRDAQLEKMKWVTQYEQIRTGIMTGDYIPEKVFYDIAGRSVINVKSRIGSISTRYANQLTRTTRTTAIQMLEEAAREVMEEVKLYDRAEYQSQTDGFMMSVNNFETAVEEDVEVAE